MSDRLTIRRVLHAVVAALLAGALFLPVAQAKDVPIYIEYTGTGLDIAVDYTVDPFPPSVVNADAKGSFGPTTTVITSKFEYIESDTTSCPDGYLHFHITYASAVTSFKNGSQLFAYVFPGDASWMCLNPVAGDYNGSVGGAFIGGVGRFAGAGGTFVSPFVGQNLTNTMIGQLGFRSIKGSIDGTVSFN